METRCLSLIGLRSARSEWSTALLVCKKCSKKLDGGFGDKRRTSLAKALRTFLQLKKGRKAALGIVEVKCLGICPKGAVTVVNGAAPGEWMLVKAGADIGEVAAALNIPASR